MKTLVFYALAISFCGGLLACKSNTQQTDIPFRLPKVPLQYSASATDLGLNSVDTIYRADSLAQRMLVSVSLIDKPAAKIWKIDTMHFVYKNRLADWEHQKRGFYWLFQDLSVSSNYARNRDGVETEVYDRYKEYFMFKPVYQPAKGDKYPTIDYKLMDEYWVKLNADVVAISNPSDGDLFVLAHPILKRIRQQDLYRMVNVTDSVPLPYYSDKVDSTRLVCLRIAVFQLNTPQH
ncbi:hypothetical protein ACJVDH_09345 [Pedobacter sp. AW1-32]|uniref:hypothetical protein n=1 Tax=Pedobacter sp. AW1-32 TaxID=3383026 RepID=UPI003FEDFB4A